MKTLIINGSPRKNGDTVSLISIFIRNLIGDVEIIAPYYDNIKPCVDCRFCWKNPGCIIDDKMQDVYEYVKTFDNVIIASPIYFSELTGPVLTFASRFQTYFAEKYVRGQPVELKEKNGVLILTGGGKGAPVQAKATAKILFSTMKTNVIGKVYSLNTDDIPAKNDRVAVDKCSELSLMLNRLYAQK